MPASGDLQRTAPPLSDELLAAIRASNQLRPAERPTTSDRTQAVRLLIDDAELAPDATAEERQEAAIARSTPLSIPAMLQRTAERDPSSVALRFKAPVDAAAGDAATPSDWQSVTFGEYQQHVLRTARTFIRLGLQPKHSVGVLAFNSPEWFYATLGAVHAGGMVAGIYTTNSAEAVLHVLRSSQANIVVVDDSKQMAKIRQIRDQLPLLRAAIQTNGPFAEYVNGEDGYFRWDDLLKQQDDDDGVLIERLTNTRVNECAAMVYTSGTVGNPKGVMLSHDSLTWCSTGIGNKLPNLQIAGETIISYLPLSHIAALIIDILVGIQFSVTVYFADKDALKGSLVKTLHEARPTRFVGVPRVFEKIHEKMMSIGAQTTGLRRTIATWAKSNALQHWLDAIDGRPTDTFQYRAARYLIMGRIKDALGLGRCSTIVSAAAPMSPELKKYFLSIDLPILEAFGMSETSGPHCIGSVDRFNLDTIGHALAGAQTRLADVDADGQGEICMRGRHVFMGYADEPDKTAEAIDADGWLHSGDLGRIDAEGFVYITGRLKELIITAGGENIPPTHIENLIRKELSALSNAFLVGDRRKYLTVLVTLKTKMDVESGEPLDELLPETQAWLQTLGVEYSTLSAVIAAGPCPKVLAAITEAIGRANKHSTSNAQKVQKFALLPHDFSVPTGELGPTLKVKRSVVAKMYAEVIDGLY